MGWLAAPSGPAHNLPHPAGSRVEATRTYRSAGPGASPAGSSQKATARGRRNIERIDAGAHRDLHGRGPRRPASCARTPAPSVPSTRASLSGRRGQLVQVTASSVSSIAATVNPWLLSTASSGGPVLQPRPRDLEHGAHADPDAAPVQRVAARGRRQHGVHAQGGGGAEDRARRWCGPRCPPAPPPGGRRPAAPAAAPGRGRCMAAIAPRCRWNPVISSSSSGVPMKAGTSGNRSKTSRRSSSHFSARKKDRGRWPAASGPAQHPGAFGDVHALRGFAELAQVRRRSAGCSRPPAGRRRNPRSGRHGSYDRGWRPEAQGHQAQREDHAAQHHRRQPAAHLGADQCRRSAN